LPAVGRLVEPALLVRPPEVADRGDVGDVGVGGMNDDPADVVRVLQPAECPGLAAVDRLDPTAALRNAVAGVAFAGPDVDHLWLPLADRDRPDAHGRLVVEDGEDVRPAVGRLPHPAAAGRHIVRVRLPLDPGHIADPTAHVPPTA